MSLFINPDNYKNDYILLKIETDIEKENPVFFYLFSFFPKEDIFFKFYEKGIIIYLKEIDFFDFTKKIQELKRRVDKSASILLDRIYSEIDSIKNYGLKGRKRLYVGYNKERKVKNRKEKEIVRGTYFYALDNNFSQKNGILPEKFLNKIIVGDSKKVLKEFPDNCIDIIFTSPPYNFGLEYENHEDGVKWESYFDNLFLIFDECIRILKFGGRILVNVQPLFSDYIPIHHIISNYFIQKKLIWKGEILWDKHNYNCKYTAWGSWKSPSNPYLKYTCEFIEIFCKGSLKHEGDSNLIDINDEEFKKWVYAKWDIPPENNMKKYGHPAMFPEALVERVLKLFSYKKDIVLDPFNGVGTTTAVAKRLSRYYVGIDISEEYCKKAEKRLEDITVNMRLF